MIKMIERNSKMKKLYLSKTDKKIFGVCGGIAETYDIDPTIVRLVFVFLTLVTFVVPLIVTYCVAGIIMPRRQ
jgi:phage shock protein C